MPMGKALQRIEGILGTIWATKAFKSSNEGISQHKAGNILVHPVSSSSTRPLDLGMTGGTLINDLSPTQLLQTLLQLRIPSKPLFFM